MIADAIANGRQATLGVQRLVTATDELELTDGVDFTCTKLIGPPPVLEV